VTLQGSSAGYEQFRSDGIPRWLVGAKVVLGLLLITGALFPDVGGFAGKGMAFRLPLFLAPALIIPIGRWVAARQGRPSSRYPWALDAGLTLPFLFDTIGNAVGLYDHVDQTDDVLHFVNWVVLVGGITAALGGAAVRRAADTPRWLILLAGGGVGAIAIIGWEIAEYLVMQAGVAGLSLTYGDTLFDLVLSTSGGFVGAWWVTRRAHR
jgi:hypothetical protein